METRLDLLSRTLALQLSGIEERKLREIAVSVCKAALNCTRVRNSLVEEFYICVAGEIEDNQCVLRHELLNFVKQLDEIQWDLQEQVELGNETTAHFAQAFRDARVFNALYYALDPDPYIAAAESIYEAFVAINDLRPLEKIVAEILSCA